jgi:[acyl-carrier-protein] S-malonyltransferase
MKIAWLFPGQGAQVVGMGKDVHQASAAARAVFAEADAALSQPLGDLCFEGPMEELTLTANTQPAIVATSAAILAAMRERLGDALPAPSCAAGHSLGEYSALVSAGAIDLRDAVLACRARGRAMQEAVPAGEGAMAAVMSLEGATVAEICAVAAGELAQIVSCANFNTPEQTVIAGHAAAVDRAAALAKTRGGKVIPLKVSAPFHCALMRPARAAVADALHDCLRPPAFEVLANVDAEPKPAREAIHRALVDQVDSPVQWVATIEAMKARGITHALEIGPGRVLAGLVKRIDRDMKTLSVNGLEAIDKVVGFLQEG